MSSVTFYKICELLLVVIYAFGADYMMTSVLGLKPLQRHIYVLLKNGVMTRPM